MADEQRNVKILFDFKRSGDTEALSSFKKLQQTIEANKATAANLKQEFAQVRTELNNLDDDGSQALVQNTERARRAAQQAQIEFAQLRGEIKAAAEQADKLGTNTQKAAATARSGGGGGGANFGTIGRGLTAFGLGEAGQLANTVDDLKDIYEQFKNIGGVSGAVATGTAAAAGGMSALMGTVLPIAGIAVAGSLALKALTDSIAAQKKAVDDVVASLKASTDSRLNDIDVIKTSTSEQIKSTIDVQKTKLQEIQAEKAQRQAFLDDINRQYTELGAALDPARRAALGQAGQVAQQSIQDLTDRENELTTAIANNTDKILPAIEAREKEAAAITKAAEDAKTFISELKRYSEIQQQLKDANAAISTAEKDRQAVIQKRAQDDLRAARISQLEAQITAAKAKEEEAARQDRIKALRADSAKAEIDSKSKTQKSISDINQRYMEQELKSLNRYLTAEQRATENYNVNRVRKLEDLYANLSELAAKGDVAAFVTTRRTGLRDIRRGDEDFSTGARQRLEDYQTERRDAVQSRNQQIAELKAAAQTELENRKTEIAEKIKLEQKAGEQQISQSQQLQQQLANLRQQFSQQDLDARRRSEDEAYRVQIGKLRERQAAITATLTNTFNPAVTSIYTLGSAVVNFINRIRQAASAPVKSLTGSAGGDTKAGRDYITAFASGTRNVPLSGVYHLDQGEAVLNRQQAAVYRSNTMPGFAGGGRQLVVNINGPIFGEVVTPSVMHQQIDEVVAGVSLAVSGAG